jgi:hypothetical protein
MLTDLLLKKEKSFQQKKTKPFEQRKSKKK